MALSRHEAKLSASLASRVLSQLPKCIHNSIDAKLKHGPFFLEHCHFKRKQIKNGILLSHCERFDWLNAVTQFDRRTCVCLSSYVLINVILMLTFMHMFVLMRKLMLMLIFVVNNYDYNLCRLMLKLMLVLMLTLMLVLM